MAPKTAFLFVLYKLKRELVKMRNTKRERWNGMPLHVIVCDYSPEWPAQFEKEARVIQSLLKDNCLAIYHIGSTSIPGMKAKPIIDIMPVVQKLEEVEALIPEFEKLGYEFMGEFGLPGRRYFRKGGDARTHHVHIYQVDNRYEIERHLAFPYYLRTHPFKAQEYAVLKESLAEQYPYDIESYGAGKDSLIKQLEREAMHWAYQKGIPLNQA